jgi:hypothetical protein
MPARRTFQVVRVGGKGAGKTVAYSGDELAIKTD